VRGLDTNVLVRFLTQDDLRQAAAAKRAIERAGKEDEPLVVSLLTLLEAEWVLRTRAKLSKSAFIVEFRRLFLQASNLIFEDEQAVGWALRLYETSKADFAECLMLAHYQRLGCSTMLTFVAGAAKLPGGELLA
jgi:predicted nucleic-acid-binding protein